MSDVNYAAVFLTGVLLLVIATVLTPIDDTNITGFATYQGNTFSVHSVNTNLFFKNASDVVSRLFNVSDSLIYSRGYISYNGQSWAPFKINSVGSNTTSNHGWIYDNGTVNISFTPSRLHLSKFRNFTDNTYAIIFTCSNSSGNNNRNCHGGWQRIKFTASINSSNYNITVPPLPPINNSGSNPSCTGSATQPCNIDYGAGIQTSALVSTTPCVGVI